MKANWGKNIENFIIVILHLALLAWIFFVLQNAGRWDGTKTFYHFLGLSLFGAFLIRGTAWLVQKRHKHLLQSE